MDKKTKPGEKGFPVVLLLLGVFVTKESVGMYREAPQLQGYGTVPLICGILLIVFSVFIIINNFRMESEIKGLPFKEKAEKVIHHLFSRDVLVMLVLILIYCLLLNFGLPFIISSPLFLWVSMTYLRRGGYVRNIIYTAIIMVFVIVVFNVAFHVVLP